MDKPSPGGGSIPAHPWRIAITGASGTGKTTLGRALSQRLCLPFIKEDIGELLAAQAQLSRLAARGKLRRSHFSGHAAVCQEHIERQNRRFAEQPGFICDRFAVDVLARVLRPPFDRVGEEWFHTLLKHTKQQLESIDLIVVPPLSDWSFQPSKNDMGRERIVAVLPKTRIHSLYSGLCVTLAPERTLFLPAGDTRHDTWIPLILEALSATKARS
ncbi:AAA family ATPase [Cyanobium sp. ATX 6A2]|uniref:AAA family ATPase n=1 Tax=Cyanobium sp. ATX 6A2 TaxID=2823700 RepID=UPI0020CDC8F5|nr:AAA family ATPase [Cyanobium sp. ATX 6A2]MCP9886669.1 AAA family ATPase [Cyanobium sp. ATX 6A2]